MNYSSVRGDIIDALAEYFHISADPNSYDWQSGGTLLGDDGEYRWLSLATILAALDNVIEDIDFNLEAD